MINQYGKLIVESFGKALESHTSRGEFRSPDEDKGLVI